MRERALARQASTTQEKQRGQLGPSFFGQGLNSEELERVRNSQDRLRHRIYFYVNGGRGINPEQGVGAMLTKQSYIISTTFS